MDEGDLRLQLMPTVEPLEFSMDQITDSDILDPDFRAFLEHQLSAPSPMTPVKMHRQASSTPFSFEDQHDFQHQNSFPNALPQPCCPQQFGLLRSPGTTELRKRKYGLVENFEMSHSLPARLSQEYLDASSSPAGYACNVNIYGPIRTCKVNTNVLTELKQSSSPDLGCAMPFSLVKKYPSSDSLSLDDINNRIQKLANNPDASRTPTNSGTSNSTQLTQQSPPMVPRRGTRKRN